MKNYLITYVDSSGKTGTFDAASLNSLAAITDFLSYCLEENISPISVLVVEHA